MWGGGEGWEGVGDVSFMSLHPHPYTPCDIATLTFAPPLLPVSSRPVFSRYSPTTVKFAMALLAKTSTAVYSDLAQRFFLPSVRHVEGQTQAQRTEFDGPRKEVIESMADIAKEKGYDESDCVGCVAFDAMKMADGVYFHAQTGRLMGLACEELNANLLVAEFKRRATNNNDTQEDKPPTRATEHLVAYWTSVKKGCNLSFLVGSWNLGSITSEFLYKNIAGSLLRELDSAGFDTVFLVCDGAGENRGLYNTLGKLTAAHFIEIDRERYPNIDLTIGVAFRHPTHSDPVFILGDMPHLAKKVVNVLEHTGGRRTERDLRRCPRGAAVGVDNPTTLSLSMLHEVYKLHGGDNLSALRLSKLTSRHFPPKEPRSRMRVNLAVQVTSTSMVRLVEETIADGAHPHITRDTHGRLVELCQHMDRLVDIINSRGDRGCGPVDGLDHKHIGELLDVLEWFSAWHAEAAARGNLQNFITREAFEDMNWLILGIVCGVGDLLGGTPSETSAAWRPDGEDVRPPRFRGGVGFGALLINLASLMQDICEVRKRRKCYPTLCPLTINQMNH